MRDFPSCFGENGVQVADASCSSVGLAKSSQNSVSCIYRCKLLGKSCLITIVWSRNLMGQCLSLEIDDASYQCICKVDVKPSLFLKRKGSKSLEVANSSKIEVFWDLSAAKFGLGPEPLEGYYIAVVFKGEMVLVIGDLRKEAFKKSGAMASLSSAAFISKREHISGKRSFNTKAQFCNDGHIHNLKIEYDDSCGDDPHLVVRIDAKIVIHVKHLQWKFRGNCAIMVDGMPVEVYWNVHNWLFGSCSGNAVFMFQSSLSTDKIALISPSSHHNSPALSWSCLPSLREAEFPGFSLFLYAWKNE